MESKFRPLGDRILVAQIVKHEATESGILLAHDNKVEIQQGIVKRVGPGLIDDSGEIAPVYVKEGDTVYFGKYAGQPIVLNDIDYTIMHEHEVLGVVD